MCALEGNIYMEARKMVLMNLFAGYERRHRGREWTCGPNRGREDGMNWESGIDIHTLLRLLLSHVSCVRLCATPQTAPGSPVPGILQARILEWVAISFSSAWKWKAKVKSLSRVQLLVTPWTAARQAPPSMGFSRQEYWSGVPSPSPDIYTLPCVK